MEKEIYKFTLTKDKVLYSKHLKGIYYSNNFIRIVDGSIYIYAGYSWDGCSPKWKKFGIVFGAPDVKCIYDAVLAHDILFQFGKEIGIVMNTANLVFYDILKQHKVWLRGCYYWFVETFGQKFWDACYFKKERC